MNWDTEEVVNWFLNDEYLYTNRYSPPKVLKQMWEEFKPSADVDIDEVDWEEVSNFFYEED